MSGATRLSRRALGLALASASAARALGRTPVGGELRLGVPWTLDEIDPHATGHAPSALFGPVLFDSLYALDAQGAPYPTLAQALPEARAGVTVVELRPQLVTARGANLDARDVIASLRRARAHGPAGLFASLVDPTLVPASPLAVGFGSSDPTALATLLAHPTAAIVPRAFAATRPDGTGAFGASLAAGRLELARNPRAARGPSFLDRARVAGAEDLPALLRAFENDELDFGWLGAGLHQPRADAVATDAGPFGWIVLRAGAEAGAWGAPGVAQQLLDAIEPGRLAHLGLAGLTQAPRDLGWGGVSAPVYVAAGDPHLIAAASAVAAALSRPGHELTPTPVPRRELSDRVRSGRHSLAIDFVRHLGPSASAVQAAILGAASPALASRPPRTTSADARAHARTTPLGVLGELRVTGAASPRFAGLTSWDLAGAHRV